MILFSSVSSTYQQNTNVHDQDSQDLRLSFKIFYFLSFVIHVTTIYTLINRIFRIVYTVHSNQCDSSNRQWKKIRELQNKKKNFLQFHFIFNWNKTSLILLFYFTSSFTHSRIGPYIGLIFTFTLHTLHVWAGMFWRKKKSRMYVALITLQFCW